ncbi:hypothetical protein FA13DRAFT_1799212 [Coprinellus micaceus]|uniref:Uncharacterized protein n=1 Tax=Coprinellus micaceus TaxID=71717 RepID=A0A4Y7SJM9_COPMI|nr:hypothetical protein FA13DRAFT_1799212 [Coprinellus micaceus]
MQFKGAFLIVAAVLASSTPAVFAKEGDVLRATRVFHTIIRQSPFLVESSTTVTWTEGPSVTDTATPTPIPSTVQLAPRA